MAGVDKLYNGNIAETFWRSGSDNVLRKYGYNYDALNRLQNAIYQKPNNTNPISGAYNENLDYDKNGNITQLNRYGAADSNIDPSLQIARCAKSPDFEQPAPQRVPIKGSANVS